MVTNRILTSKPVLFVGDIHGNIDVLTKAVDYADVYNTKVVFVGDYVDSYPNSRADQEKCLKYVKEHHMDDNKFFLRGNHENNYLKHEKWACSGYARSFHRDIAPVMNSIEFLDYIIVDNNILVTHAGLSGVFVKETWADTSFPSMTDGEIMEAVTKGMEEALEDPEDPIYSAGYDSGGTHPSGGIFWCRPKNFQSFGDNIIQIFGHTRDNKVRIYPSDKAFCIDCLENPMKSYQALLYNEKGAGNFNVISL